MKKPLIVGVLALALTGAAWWAFGWWQHGRFQESTNNAYVRRNVAVISAKVPGYVDQVLVQENQIVERDQILFSLHKEAYAAQVEGAQARVASEQANLARLEQRLSLQQATIAATAAQVRTATVSLERASLDLKRAEALKAKALDSRQRYDHALNDVRGGEAELARTRAELTAAEAEVRVLAAEREQAAADHRRAAADLRLAQINLYLADVRAPWAGIVGSKFIQAGDYVSVGARKMALVALAEVWVSANFKETQLTAMVPGQRATVVIDSFPDQLLTGSVDSLAPASGAEFSLLPPDNATGNFTKIVQRVPVRIALDPDSPILDHLRPGMSATVTVDTRTAPALRDAAAALR